VKLQARQKDFESRDAGFLVVGSRPEPIDVAKQSATKDGISYPILYDSDTSATRSLGLWSDQMQMPFMGYVVIDKSGRIIAGEQVLSEAKGAADQNIDQILRALESVKSGASATARAAGGS